MKDSVLKSILDKLQGVQKTLEIKLSAEPEVQVEAATEVVLTGKDGSVYKCEGELVAGSVLYLVDVNGETVAEDGVIELEDGTMITVTEGKISAVEASPAGPDPSTEMEATMAAIEASTDPKDMLLKSLLNTQKQFNELAEKYTASMSAIENKNESLSKELADLKALRTEENKLVLETIQTQFSAIEELSKLPNGGEPEADKRRQVPAPKPLNFRIAGRN